MSYAQPCPQCQGSRPSSERLQNEGRHSQDGLSLFWKTVGRRNEGWRMTEWVGLPQRPQGLMETIRSTPVPSFLQASAVGACIGFPQ